MEKELNHRTAGGKEKGTRRKGTRCEGPWLGSWMTWGHMAFWVEKQS